LLSYCAAVDVVTLGQVDRVLLRTYRSNLAGRSDRGVVLVGGDPAAPAGGDAVVPEIPRPGGMVAR
jgi:hypothetical protein